MPPGSLVPRIRRSAMSWSTLGARCTHKAAMSRKRAESAKARGESAVLSSPIGCALSTLDPTTRARMGRIFDVCFMMAQEGIAFAKYPSLLELEKRHGVDLGHAYTTADSLVIILSNDCRVP